MDRYLDGAGPGVPDGHWGSAQERQRDDKQDAGPGAEEDGLDDAEETTNAERKGR
jgi:hypothetical protein